MIAAVASALASTTGIFYRLFLILIVLQVWIIGRLGAIDRTLDGVVEFGVLRGFLRRFALLVGRRRQGAGGSDQA